MACSVAIRSQRSSQGSKKELSIESDARACGVRQKTRTPRVTYPEFRAPPLYGSTSGTTRMKCEIRRIANPVPRGYISMVDVFSLVIKVATEKNYKRRSSMEEV